MNEMWLYMKPYICVVISSRLTNRAAQLMLNEYWHEETFWCNRKRRFSVWFGASSSISGLVDLFCCCFA